MICLASVVNWVRTTVALNFPPVLVGVVFGGGIAGFDPFVLVSGVLFLCCLVGVVFGTGIAGFDPYVLVSGGEFLCCLVSGGEFDNLLCLLCSPCFVCPFVSASAISLVFCAISFKSFSLSWQTCLVAFVSFGLHALSLSFSFACVCFKLDSSMYSWVVDLDGLGMVVVGLLVNVRCCVVGLVVCGLGMVVGLLPVVNVRSLLVPTKPSSSSGTKEKKEQEFRTCGVVAFDLDKQRPSYLPSAASAQLIPPVFKIYVSFFNYQTAQQL